MLQSHVVEVNGTFVGAAVTTITGFRFRAVDVRVDELDQTTWRSLDELDRAVRHLFTTGRVSAILASSGANPLESAANSLLRASATGASPWMA